MKSKKSGVFILVAVFIMVAYAVIRLIFLQIDINEQKIKNAGLQKKVDILDAEKEELNAIISVELTDEQIERIAREYLNMGFPGEHVYIDIGNEQK